MELGRIESFRFVKLKRTRKAKPEKASKLSWRLHMMALRKHFISVEDFFANQKARN